MEFEDYILPLAEKHNELTKIRAIKYWERKPKPNGRASSVAQKYSPQVRANLMLKPITAEPRKRNKDIITCEKLFRQFKASGKLNDPESPAPWVDLEKKKELK